MNRLAARTPLRTTLVVALVALVALGLVGAGFASTTALRGYLLDEEDHRLEQVADAYTRGGPGGPPGGFGGRGPFGNGQAGPGLPADFYGAVVDSAGVVIELIVPEIRDRDDTPDLPGWDAAEVADHADDPVTIGGSDDDWRLIAIPLDSGDSVLIASSLADVNDTVNRLTLLNLLVGAVVLVLVGLLAYFGVRRSLRPLDEMEATAAAIAGGDLARRVPDRDPRTEVGRLGQALNAMLGRIESAFRAQQQSETDARQSEERMRRFVADASHELRTPLTSIRGFAELYRQGAASDVPRLMGRIESESERMGGLVEDLLLLARLDEARVDEHREARRSLVELGDLAADAVHDARAVDPQRPIRLVAGDPVVVDGDEHQLRQVLANLVGNALHHTPAGTPVTVTVREEGSQALIEVADEGPGLAAEHAERIFERFYRADPSRSRSSGGAGLGLSIVAALAVAHGGSVEVDTAPGRGSVFRVRLALFAGVDM